MISDFLNGIAAGSANVATGSEVVDGGGDLVAQVIDFFTDLVENFGS